MNPSPPHVNAPLAYLADGPHAIEHRVYPVNSGRASSRPPSAPVTLPVFDARTIATSLALDVQGFELHHFPPVAGDCYDDAFVRTHYFPQVEAFVREVLGAHCVIVFDYNTRSSLRAARGAPGVRVPVAAVHNDYTERSGPRRAREILAGAGREDLVHRRHALVNLWRPLVGPVQDTPLALCDARTVRPEDIVDTPIHHYAESNLQQPRHSGEVQSLRHASRHAWYWFSDMLPHEALLLKCYDSATDGRARFTPHTGFNNPACPADFAPRESIEARTLVIF
jgi:hypothetical protein